MLSPRRSNLNHLRWTSSSSPCRDTMILRVHWSLHLTIVMCAFFTGVLGPLPSLPKSHPPTHSAAQSQAKGSSGLSMCSLCKHVRARGFAEIRVHGPSHWETPYIVRRVSLWYASLKHPPPPASHFCSASTETKPESFFLKAAI